MNNSTIVDAFGLSVINGSPVSSGMQWGGGYYNGGITPYLLKARRYYNASTCRFMSRDPVGYGGGINQYAFAGNDPVNNADPSGLQAVVPSPTPPPSMSDGSGDEVVDPIKDPDPDGVRVTTDDPRLANAGYAEMIQGIGDAIDQQFAGGDGEGIPAEGGGCLDAPGEDESGASPSLSKAERVQKFFDLMDTLPNASNPNEAFDQMNGALTSVEDDYSGVEEEDDPGKDYTGRMYPPKADSITIEPDGTIIGKTKGNILRAGPDGFITVTKLNGDILWTKDGGG